MSTTPNTNKNKMHFKLKKVFYAPATVNEDTGIVTYAAPKRIHRSVSATFNPKGELIKVFADAQEIIVGRENAGYDGELEMLRIPEDFETDCLSATKNADGTITENISDASKPFALLFEFEGDAKAIRHCLFLCYANKPGIEGGNSESKTPTNEKISIVSRPRPDGTIKTKTGDETTTEVYENWYNAVPGSTSSGGEAAATKAE